MALADSSSSRLAIVAETTEGTTPETPSFQTTRYRSETLTRAKETVISEEIRSDGNVSDIIKVGEMANGGFNAELSYGTYDTLFESLLCGTFASDVLKNGRDRHSFTVEKTIELGATDAYLRYTGMIAQQLELDITAKQIITANWTMLGRGGGSGSAAITGATYTNASTTPVLAASNDVGSLTISGLTGDAPILRRAQINITNNAYDQPQVGSVQLAGIGLGQFVVSGTIEVYFGNINIYDALHDHDTLGLSLNLGSVSGSKYTLEIPSIKLTEGEPVVSGNNQAVMLNTGFQAFFNASESASMKLTRAVA